MGSKIYLGTSIFGILTLGVCLTLGILGSVSSPADTALPKVQVGAIVLTDSEKTKLIATSSVGLFFDFALIWVLYDFYKEIRLNRGTAGMQSRI